MGTKYSLTNTQIKGLANICYREQGSNLNGVRACASHMCNYYELYGKKKFSSVYDCTISSGWYGTAAFNAPYVNGNAASQTIIDAVKDVINNGNRFFPQYIDEYDCISDISSATNNGIAINKNDRHQYKKDITKIKNVYGSSWTFYCFPDGADGYCDPFGYINKPAGSTTEKTTSVSTAASTIAEKAVKWAEEIAADQSHGYSQSNRWGPDYDCSSLVINAYKKAGVPIDINKVYYTGNMQGLKNYGFVDVTKSINLDTGAGLKRGDILYYHISGTNGHTAMYSGNGKIVHARGQSYGSPASGDQGTEIAVTKYSRSKWQYVLRYGGGATAANNNTSTSSSSSEYKYGDKSSGVKNIQKLLNKLGYNLEEDGDFGPKTYNAVVDFQDKNGLAVDGIVGVKTLTKLKEKTNNKTQKTDENYTVTKKVKYIGKVTDNNLNVRSGPGYSYSNIKSWPRLEKNYKVDVCDTVISSDGSKWLYICINKSIYGFVAAEYIQKI